MRTLSKRVERLESKKTKRANLSIAVRGGLLVTLAVAGTLGVGACLPAAEEAGSESSAPVTAQTAPKEQTNTASPELALLPANNGYQVKEGLIFAGQVTEDELRTLAAADYRVLDLRGEDESRGYAESSVAEDLGLDYQNLPVVEGGLGDAAIHAAFREALLADTDTEGPLVVHCGSGNRVAGLYYAFLVEDGVERQQALARAKQAGLTSQGIQSAVEAYLDQNSVHDP